MVFIGSSLFAEEIEVYPKRFDMSQEYLLIEGSWVEINSTFDDRLIPKLNSLTILCVKSEMECREIRASLSNPKDNDLFDKKLLFAQENIYDIAEWNQNSILAKREPRAANINLNISIADEHVEMIYRETTARGAESSDSSLYAHYEIR